MATAWKDQVFAAVSEAAAIDTIKLFRPDPAEAAEQKRQFMAGEVRNPRYTYQALKGKRLGPVLDRLERAIETDSQLVEELDTSPLSRLFGESLERRRALLRLARAAQSRDMTAFAAPDASAPVDLRQPAAHGHFVPRAPDTASVTTETAREPAAVVPQSHADDVVERYRARR